MEQTISASGYNMHISAREQNVEVSGIQSTLNLIEYGLEPSVHFIKERSFTITECNVVNWFMTNLSRYSEPPLFAYYHNYAKIVFTSYS